MEKVLIFRSVSLQQLDRNLPAIQSAFPGAEFHLLTHPHAVAECRKYPGLARVVPMATAASFSPFRLPSGLRSEGYAAAVVPVANRSGVGFLNVFLAAWACGARRLYRCSLSSEIREVRRFGLLGRWAKNGLCHIVAGLLTVAAAPPALLMLGWNLFRAGVRKGKQAPPA